MKLKRSRQTKLRTNARHQEGREKSREAHDGGDVDSELELQELADVVVDAATPHDGLHVRMIFGHFVLSTTRHFKVHTCLRAYTCASRRKLATCAHCCNTTCVHCCNTTCVHCCNTTCAHCCNTMCIARCADRGAVHADTQTNTNECKDPKLEARVHNVSGFIAPAPRICNSTYARRKHALQSPRTAP